LFRARRTQTFYFINKNSGLKKTTETFSDKMSHFRQPTTRAAHRTQKVNPSQVITALSDFREIHTKAAQGHLGHTPIKLKT